MNELALYFNALPEELGAESDSYADMCFATELYCHTFPKLQPGGVALIGLPEGVADDPEDLLFELADAFRARFYRLKRMARTIMLYDLGNLRPGDTDEQTHERLSSVIESLSALGVIPILIGNRRERMLGHYMGLAAEGGPLNVAHIDSTLDLDQEEGVLHSIVTALPDLPTHFCQLAYQSYLVDPMGLSVLERLHFEALRLGQIHEDFRRAEPHLRESDLVFFSLSALRRQAFEHAPGARPFGLNGEQACQLCWYAGTSSRVKSIGFYNILPEATADERDLETLSIMIWHFLEGYSYRQDETPRREEATAHGTERYRIPIPGQQELVFYRSLSTDRWWVEVPRADEEDEPYLLPCLYEDYREASMGHLPDRWMRALGRV